LEESYDSLFSGAAVATMTIETNCSHCQRPLRLKPELAGKRIKCPQCKAVIVVPELAVATPPPTSTPPTHTPPASTPPTAVPARQVAATVATPATIPKPKESAKPVVSLWHLKTEDDEIYGPVPRAELHQWDAQGRVNIDCQLLLDGSDQWQWATDLYPDLDDESEPAEPAAAAQQVSSATEGPKSRDAGDKGVSSRAPSTTTLKVPAATPSSPSPPAAPKPAAPAPVTPASPAASQPAPAFTLPVTTSSPKSSWRAEPHPGKKTPVAPVDEALEQEPDESEESDDAADDEDSELAISDRRWVTTFLLAFFLGTLGIHRFYLGRVLTGVAMLFTLGGLLIWQIVDVASIALERLPDHLGRPLRK